MPQTGRTAITKQGWAGKTYNSFETLKQAEERCNMPEGPFNTLVKKQATI